MAIVKRKFDTAWHRFRGWLSSERGQNTVEYLLMLTVVVGVVLIAGAALKKFMPTLFGQIQGMITGAAGSMGSGGQ